MSLATRITALAQAIGTDIKTLTTNQGSLAALSTTAKTSLVAAINELSAAIAVASSILDSAGAGDTAHTWSADKIITQLNALKAELLGGTPAAAYDTLVEIAAALSGDAASISGLLTAVGERVSYAAAQTLTSPQQQQARDNIGAASAATLATLTTDVGDPATDFAAQYAAAKV